MFSFNQSAIGMGLMSFGQSSLFYNGLSLPFNFISELSPEKILTYVLPSFWSNYSVPIEIYRLEKINYPSFFSNLKKAFAEYVIRVISNFGSVIDVGSILGKYTSDYGISLDVVFNYYWLRNQLSNTINEMVSGSLVVKKRPVEKDQLYMALIDSILSSVTASLQFTLKSYKIALNKISRIRRQITNIIMSEIKKEVSHRRNLYNMVKETINQESELFN